MVILAIAARQEDLPPKVPRDSRMLCRQVSLRMRTLKRRSALEMTRIKKAGASPQIRSRLPNVVPDRQGTAGQFAREAGSASPGDSGFDTHPSQRPTYPL